MNKLFKNKSNPGYKYVILIYTTTITKTMHTFVKLSIYSNRYEEEFMINKRSIWFLTLFSLILVLSVYYITMPSELLLNTNGNYNKEEPNVKIEESTALTALRVEADNEMLKELDELKLILMDQNTTLEEKNKSLDKMKEINLNRGEEEKLENKILEEFKLQSFVKIEGNNIKIVIKSKTHNNELANNIMRKVQENFEQKKYISVKFTD